MRRRYAALLAVITLLLTAGISCFLHRSSEGVLKDKSILLLGDSLLAGYGVEGTWCHGLETEYGMNVTNVSVDGATMAARGDTQKYDYFCSYYPAVIREFPDEDYDMIFITGGANDWMLSIELGSETDTGMDTYCGAIRTLVERLRGQCPDAVIVFSTTWEFGDSLNDLGLTLGDYNSTLIHMCKLLDVNVICANDPETNGMHMLDAGFRQKYGLTPSDCWHLNEEGHALYLPIIASQLETLF